MIVEGKIREGLTYPFVEGDHVGYKFIGILPALVEQKTGANSHIPAYFFGSFSVIVILLLWRISLRASSDPFLALPAPIFAACSSALFYSARHVAPFDAAMAFSMAALLIGLRRETSLIRSTLVGLIAGLGFIIYYGYWTSAGAVVLIHLLYSTDSWWARIRSGLATTVGIALAVAFALGMNHLGGGHALSGAKGLSDSIVVGDFRGHIMPWEFLFRADGALLVLIATTALIALITGIRTDAAKEFHRNPAFLFSLGALIVWVSFIVTANVLHKFVVHARLARQLVPLLCLAAGLSAPVATLVRGRRWWICGIAATALLIETGWRFRLPLTQEFPADFKRRGDELLTRLNLKDGADSYYRYVNVEKFIYEPETLRVEPRRTLLAARHPFEYWPYLYEGDTLESRALRRSVDHRMRLVEMPVQPSERVDPGAGVVEIEAEFPQNRGGFSEPLLSVATDTGGDLLLVRYTADDRIIFVVERIGYTVAESEPVTISRNRRARVSFYSGILRATPAGQSSSAAYLKDKLYDSLVSVTVNDRPVLQRFFSAPETRGMRLYAGLNRLDKGMAENEFSGKILKASHIGMPGLPSGISIERMLGAIDISTVLRKGVAEVEPLFTAGDQQRALVGYLRSATTDTVVAGVLLSDGQRLESIPFSADNASHNLLFSIGAYYPSDDSDEWKSIDPETRQRVKKAVIVTVDDRVVLERNIDVPVASEPELVWACNLSNDSSIAPRYTGKITESKVRGPSVSLAKRLMVSRIDAGMGPVRLEVRLPKPFPASPEPLLTLGRAGAADIAYIVYIDDHHVQLGVDHWGAGATLSKPISAEPGSKHVITIESPALAPEADRSALKQMRVSCDGALVVESTTTPYIVEKFEISAGENSIGASTCAPSFTGSIESATVQKRE